MESFVSAPVTYFIILVAVLFAAKTSSEPRACIQTLVTDLAADTTPKKHTNFTCCLAMIIKNEGPLIPRLFESVKGFASEYCIVDTGSTDDTIDVVKSMDLPGVVFEEPFVDFATTRNYMMDRCREASRADYLLLLDADMVLRVSDQWDWTKLDGKDVYNLIQFWGVEYENVRLVRREATADIRVVGSTHEYYHVPPHYSHGLLPKSLLYIEDVGDGKAKADKFERDERLLRKDLAADPNNGRTIFYLGNTLKSLGRYEEAIQYYKQRANMSGWFADRDYSIYQISTCFLALNELEDAKRYAEMAAFDGAVPRAEPLYDLIFYLHRHEKYLLAWYYLNMAERILKPQVAHALFISNDIYDFWMAYERATLCRHVFTAKDNALCALASMNFLNNVHPPEHLRDYFVRHELGFQVRALDGADTLLDKDGSTQRFNGFEAQASSSASADDFTSDSRLPSLFMIGASTHCVKQWYPFTVGQYDASSGECLPLSWFATTPRSLSFLGTATNGLKIGDEIWFLTRWKQEFSGFLPLFSFVILRDNGSFKAHTMPFTLEFMKDELVDHNKISISSSDVDAGAGKAIDIAYYGAPRDGRHIRIHRVFLTDLYAWIV